MSHVRIPTPVNHLTGSAKLVPKKSDPEILGPEPAYNDPEISMLGFLEAVVRDKRLPMSVRIDAAAKASVYLHPRLAQVTQDVTAGVTIRIQGGLPALPGTNIIMPEHEQVPNPPANTPKGNGHDPDAQ